MIIGLGHYSRTGKDTFADEFIKELHRGDAFFPAKKLSFASKLKQISHELYAGFGMREEAFYNTKAGAPYRDIPLEFINKTPVEIWIEVGMKLREVYPNTWRDYVLNNVSEGITLIPDVRFPNEAAAIQDSGIDNILIKMVRPGVAPRDSDADTALLGYSDWDYILGGFQVENVKHDARRFAAWVLGTIAKPTRDLQREAWLLEEERKAMEQQCAITTV